MIFTNQEYLFSFLLNIIIIVNLSNRLPDSVNNCNTLAT